MEGSQQEKLTPSAICSEIVGVIGFGGLVVGILIQWGGLIPVPEEDFSASSVSASTTPRPNLLALAMMGFGALMYFCHILEALLGSNTSKYLSYILSEAEFRGYVKGLQEARPKITWSIVNYHYETRTTRDSEGKEKQETQRVTTHCASADYDIKSFVDETLSPEEMIATFHLMCGENQDVAQKTKAFRVFLLCEMPLEYHPFDDQEEERMNQKREAFYKANTKDTHQDKFSQNLIEFVDAKSHVMVILKENTDDSNDRPWWMHYWVFVLCTLFLLSVPYRCYFFSRCKKVQWEVLKHFSHQHEAVLGQMEPKNTRAKRTDAASRAFRGVKRATNQPSVVGVSTSL